MPKLSICMPTYNRAHLIERAIASVSVLHDRGVDLEVIISDNASTDNTQEIVRRISQDFPYIRYFRNSQNFGSLVNYQICLRRSRGNYALYLADDDTLIAEGVLSALEVLDAHPDVLQVVLPFQTWDDREQRASGKWPNLDKPILIGQGDFASSLTLFVNDIVLPEISILRREVVDRIIVEKVDAYYAFTNFSKALSCGAVWLHNRPAYQFHMTNQGEMNTEGWNVAIESIEDFRGGLEYCIYHLDKITPLSPIERDRYKAMIEKHLQSRMLNTSKRLFLKKDYRRSYILLQRLSVLVTEEKQKKEIADLFELVAPLACAQEVAFMAREGFGAVHLALQKDMLDPTYDQVVSAALEMGGLTLVGIKDAARNGLQEKTVVLVQRPELLDPVLDEGFPRPHIFLYSAMLVATGC